MHAPQASTRSYRCSFFPKDDRGVVHLIDSGALPSIRVQARNGGEAELLGNAMVNGVVATVERIDEGTVGISLEASAEVLV